MRRSARIVTAVSALAIYACSISVQAAPNAASSTQYPGASWAVAPPDQNHWSEEKLKVAREYSNSIDSSSVMIIQHGLVIAQWGELDRKISSYSIRKSLLSALYGIYSHEKRINTDSTLAQLGISDAPDPLTDNERKARVVDLLRARSGVYHPVDFETKAMIETRPQRESHAPGTFWFYNNWDFNTLGTIFEKSVGMPIGKAFYQRIAIPLHMQDFEPDDVYYIEGPISVHRAFHFRMTARDLARFGLLYLRGGRWNGHQIVRKEWVEKSSHANEMIQFGGGAAGGYEYLWWVSYHGKHLPGVTVPEGTYSAQGAGGHYLVIIPSLDLVVVHRWANDPPTHDPATVIDWAFKGITRAQFGHLLQLILDAAPL
jgi:CubicO group peptidase (beta-lactamase class C family)